MGVGVDVPQIGPTSQFGCFANHSMGTASHGQYDLLLFENKVCKSCEQCLGQLIVYELIMGLVSADKHPHLIHLA